MMRAVRAAVVVCGGRLLATAVFSNQIIPRRAPPTKKQNPKWVLSVCSEIIEQIDD
jgi:hypothetical protein